MQSQVQLEVKYYDPGDFVQLQLLLCAKRLVPLDATGQPPI